MNTSHLGLLAISDTGFVFDPRTGHSYTVNSTGLTLLRGLKQGLTLPQIRDSLEATHDCSYDMSTDLGTFIKTLENYQLLGNSGQT